MGLKFFSYFIMSSSLLLFLLPLVTSFPNFIPPPNANGQLDYRYYDWSCPNLETIVRYGVWAASKNDNRIAASLLRMHFHDCFVNGCDGSILLDDKSDFKGEKNAPPNRNSVRGYKVIDSIKADVEKACPLTVSCSDILTLAAREAVVLSGGPYWPVPLGRQDGLTASEKAVIDQLPSPLETLENISAEFTSKGLDIKDVVALSGAHTLGFAQCFTFKMRLFNFQGSGKPDPTFDSSVLGYLQSMCPNNDGPNTNLVSPDSTAYKFDNVYYGNIVKNTSLLGSDQALLGDPKTAAMVNSYSTDPYLFSGDFAASMVDIFVPSEAVKIE